MSDFDINFNSLKNINIEQLLKIIQLQSEQIESQKRQINALIKCQQTLLEGMYQNRPNNFNDPSKSFVWPPVLNRNVPTNFSPLNNATGKSDFNAFDASNSPSRLSVPRKTQHPAPEYPNSDFRQTFHQETNEPDGHELLCQVKKEAANKVQMDPINLIGAQFNELESIDEEEDLNLSSLQEFASKFKVRRIELGFTQRDVGVCLGLMQGNDFSQTTLSRFEALNLSYRNMRKLQPLLQRWLDAIEREGRDTIMARVSAFYQQQRSMIEDDPDNVDPAFGGIQCKKRLTLEAPDLPELLHDQFKRATADSTTTHIKTSPTFIPHSMTLNTTHNITHNVLQHPLSNMHTILPNSFILASTNATALPSSLPDNSGAIFNMKKRRKRAKMSEEMLVRLESIMGSQKMDNPRN